MKANSALVWLMLCEIPPLALADELQGKPWSDEAEFSFVSTGGNSDVETLSVKNLQINRGQTEASPVPRAHA